MRRALSPRIYFHCGIGTSERICTEQEDTPCVAAYIALGFGSVHDLNGVPLNTLLDSWHRESSNTLYRG